MCSSDLVEVLSVNAKRSTRTDREGRFTLSRLPFGQQLVMARYPGFQPGDEAVNMLNESMPPLTFRLRRVVQAIDTVRIVSHDGCAPYDFAGFACRRRAGVGQFRGEAELGALRPHYWADMFEGLPGLRNYQVPDRQMGFDWRVESTTGWRCLEEGWNGRERTANLENVRPGDIVAVSDVNLHIENGEYIVFLGPSGCGKTTTLRMIGGHDEPSSGTITIDGDLLNGVSPAERPITTVFQHYALFPHKSVLQNVAFGLKMQGMDKAEREAQAKAAIDIVGLTPMMDRKPQIGRAHV